MNIEAESLTAMVAGRGARARGEEREEIKSDAVGSDDLYLAEGLLQVIHTKQTSEHAAW